jgi:hypothetical protein
VAMQESGVGKEAMGAYIPDAAASPRSHMMRSFQQRAFDVCLLSAGDWGDSSVENNATRATIVAKNGARPVARTKAASEYVRLQATAGDCIASRQSTC